MTLKYSLFGIPGNEREFLDKEKNLGNRDLHIYLQRNYKQEIIGYLTTLKQNLFLISTNSKSQFKVKLDRSYFSPDYLKGEFPMIHEESPLVKDLNKKGFKIISRIVGAVSPKKKFFQNI